MKKIYKSKSIKPYGFNKTDYVGYAIYFNKKELKDIPLEELKFYLKRNYPYISQYLLQYESDLQEILINAKEKAKNIYYPRRGAFIRGLDENEKEILVDLEICYELGKKIFFRYISETNEFGYADKEYFATSDTYFLWPKYSEDYLDYPFFLAYLNSKIVNFIFKAKNITIKRSKTKIEKMLPIPNIDKFYDTDAVISDKYIPKIKLIRTLSRALIEINKDSKKMSLDSFIEYFTRKYFESKYYYDEPFMFTVLNALENKDELVLKEAIDHLFFQFFDIEEKEIDNLLETYYNF